MGSVPIYEPKLKSLQRIGRGKVREIYAVDDERMLIVTSDRLSAFDVVMSEPIPDKGRVLTEMSNFWFAKLGHIVPNHLTGVDPESVVDGEEEKAQVRGRSMVVKKLNPLPIEAVVRGYIIGSGWKDYQKTGAVCGIQLPKGLQQYVTAVCFVQECHGPEKQKKVSGGSGVQLALPRSWHQARHLVDPSSRTSSISSTWARCRGKTKQHPADGDVRDMVALLTPLVAEGHARLSTTGGQTVLRQLNRQEYTNTVGDLFWS